MQAVSRVFVLLLLDSASAFADPWGWAEGPSGRTPLTGSAVPSDATNVAFAAGEVAFDGIALADRKLSFTADPAGTTLAVGGAQSGFDLSGASGDWMFRGISFVGTGDCADTVYDGGAICCSGGRLTLEGCTFDNVNARFTGGAVSAYLMDGDVSVSNCMFTRNASGPMNGMGGALYVSRGSSGAGTLRLDGCTFRGNSAQNGGAVATVRVIDDFESPMPVEMSGCAFRGNTADYSGGAVDDEGDLSVTNTLFADNGAALQGGAICAGTSDPDWAGADLTLLAGTEFRGNSATNLVADSRYWTCGGAVAVAGAGFSLSVSGRHVVFEGNRAESASSSSGGAIAAVEGTEVDVSCAAFLANRASSGGGAVCSWGDKLGISTSIFSNNTVTAANGYGGAVSVESGAALAMRNSTVRGSNGGAIDVYRASAQVVNCVVVDNGATDLAFTESSASFVSSVCGTLVNVDGSGIAVPLSDCACSLTNRTAAIYAGDALRLRPTGFNEVAALGLRQDALDYDGVAYGSRPVGYSMGAYETPADGLLATVRGSRRYDGTTSGPTNLTWSLVDSDGRSVGLPGLGGLTNLFAVTGWEFASCNAGVYSSTNALPSKRIDLSYSVKPGPYAFYADVVSLVAEGEILKRPLKFRSASAEKVYDSLPLTTNGVTWTRQDEDGFGTGVLTAEEGFLSFDVTGSRTEVGASPNLFEVVWGEGIAPSNYESRVEYGTLTVTARPDPVVEIAEIRWYHNRSDGLFYPQITLRFVGGDSSRIVRFIMTCDGVDHELPASCVMALRTATAGDEFVFGVDPASFVQYPGSPENWGFVPPNDRLFGVFDATRPIGFSVDVQGTLDVDGPDPEIDMKGESPASPTALESSTSELTASGPVEKLVQGVKFSRVLTDLPEPKITASGLPNGLKIVATPVKEQIGRSVKTVGYTCVLSGTPTKAGVYHVKFSQKVGKKTYVTKEELVVGKLPLWASGTFTGWSASDAGGFEDVGAATMTVTSAGKISGSVTVQGKKWTFSATGYDAAPSAEGDAFDVTVQAKNGKLCRNVRVKVSPDAFEGCASADLSGDGVLAGLHRTVWSDKPAQWKISKAKFTLDELGCPNVKVSVATSGKVTFSGKLPDGRSVSGSSTAFVDESGAFHAYLIVPQKNGMGGLLLDVLLSSETRLYGVDVKPGTGLKCCQGFSEAFVQGVKSAWTLTDDPGPMITASGLPGGVKVVATAVKETVGRLVKTIGFTYELSGVPTKAGVYHVKFARKVGEETCITEGKLEVVELPLWAHGTFTGWSASDAGGFEDVGAATMTVTSAGKISGSVTVQGKKWTFSASGYDAAPSAGDDAFDVTVQAKNGKLCRDVHVRVSPDAFEGCAAADLSGDGVLAGLHRTVWSDKPAQWKISKAKFSIDELGCPNVKVSVATSGKVTFSGKLPDGRSVSGSSTAFVGESGAFHAYLIVPQKNGRPGFLFDIPLAESEVAR